MIVIVDYCMGNLGSIANMLKKIGTSAIISSDLDVISQAQKLILPGVGAFDHGMTRLKEMDILPVLNDQVLNAGVPVLGICLGMQLMTRRSEEGNLPGLGWIEADTVRFNFAPEQTELKVPHMGWNNVRIAKDHELFTPLAPPIRYYFVHSFYVACDVAEDILTWTKYGCDFVSGFSRANITGVQFHPEKSHKYGMTLLRNWVTR
jgi:glutamine amidotransferase